MKTKSFILVYCLNNDKETIEKALKAGKKIRALERFDGIVEPGSIEKVEIVGHDTRGVKSVYEAAKIKVELCKGSKADKIEIPKPLPAAVQSSDTVDEPPAEEEKEEPVKDEKSELIEQGKALGLKLKKTMSPKTMIKLINEVEEAKE